MPQNFNMKKWYQTNTSESSQIGDKPKLLPTHVLGFVMHDIQFRPVRFLVIPVKDAASNCQTQNPNTNKQVASSNTHPDMKRKEKDTLREKP